MKITLSFAYQLRQLCRGEQIPLGEFRGKTRVLLNQLLNDEVVEYKPVGTQQKMIYCTDKDNLEQYLHHKLEIPSLEKYILFLESEDTSRSDAVKATSDSKFRDVELVKGFFVNGYNDIVGHLHGEVVTWKPVHGSFLFVRDYEHFVIPTDITVVVVEGYENFRDVERQRYLFTDIKPLFIWRYQNSKAIISWLAKIPNPYLHFGDFDPKGIHIYISEFRSKIEANRCRFLIPENIESLLMLHGERELYERQMERLRDFPFEDYAEIKDLIAIIRKVRKGLSQEVLIE